MSEIITIPKTSTSSDGVVYYHISIKLPLRSFTITKRYSEFDELVTKLCSDLGIDHQDFPYPLPPKTGLFLLSKSDAIKRERKVKLSQFLNSVIRDNDLQNNRVVHNFLQLPINFKFTSTFFRASSTDDQADLIITDEDAIDQCKWLEILRLFKFTIGELTRNYDHLVPLKISTRDKVNKLIKPNLNKLAHRLEVLAKKREIDSAEHTRRRLLLEQVENSLLNLQDSLLATSNYTAKPIPDRNELLASAGGRRVLGGKAPRETNDTIGLSNKELLQQQVQVHKAQDLEVEQLRKIIARQRQLGESINTEVQEQSQLLDMFAEEVDNASEKLRHARQKARNII